MGLLATTENSGYLQTLENLNLYSPTNVYDLNSSALVDAISSIVNGLEGVSVGFQNTLVARLLLPNTPIQQIGTIQLAKNIAATAASNLRNLVLPTLNITGTDISFRSPNYWNISNSTEDRSISGLLQSILNYTPAVNPIPQISIGPNKTITSDISNEYLKGNRGKGQIDAYNLNIQLNDYSPDEITKQYGGQSINQEDIILGTYNKSLLAITNNIIAQNSLDNNSYQPIIGGKSGDTINPATLAFANPTITDSPILGSNKEYGSGNLIAKGDGTFTDNTNTKFLRVFNYQKGYQGTGDLMKFKHGYAGSNSVLQTVFPRISPLKIDKDVRNLMFSIENLAYSTSTFNLPKYEIGPFKGRAMWFPPYGLTINENTTANWSNVDFLGRSEPIYTFNNREKSVNIGFTLIVDYPSQLNDTIWQTNTDNDFAIFFRQDNQLNPKNSQSTNDQKNVATISQLPVTKTAIASSPNSGYEYGQNPLVIYFDNDISIPTPYLTQDNNGIGQAGNNDFYARLVTFINFLNSPQGQIYNINLTGFASSVGDDAANVLLSKQRALNVQQTLIAGGLYDSATTRCIIIPKGDTNAVVSATAPNALNAAVIDRKVVVSLKYNVQLDSQAKSSVQDKSQQNTQITQLNNNNSNNSLINLQGNGSTLFKQYKNGENQQLILQKYSEEIDYFHPVFHSQTPEDFSTRLTFLEQCTVQGAALNGGTNSVFGTPPICILRLGDFFYSKIIITSINKTYEPLIWDTNPEGIGMQPMICNVSLDCKVIGGQDLTGPINKLQNALSYNFYANTSVFNAGKKAQKESKRVLSGKSF